MPRWSDVGCGHGISTLADGGAYPNSALCALCGLRFVGFVGFDPLGAARHVRDTLEPDGTWMIVEPFAHDRVEDNLTPVGRIFYAASTMVCVPASLRTTVRPLECRLAKHGCVPL